MFYIQGITVGGPELVKLLGAGQKGKKEVFYEELAFARNLLAEAGRPSGFLETEQPVRVKAGVQVCCMSKAFPHNRFDKLRSFSGPFGF